MENTENNKVKFFAQYWGQKVFINPALSPIPVANTYIFDYPDPEDIEQDYLELKPRSSITKENLIKIAKFYQPTAHNVKLNDDQIEFDFIYGDDHASGAIQVDSDYCLDYLRSNGFAMEWMGLSVEQLEEYGWIIIKDHE